MAAQSPWECSGTVATLNLPDLQGELPDDARHAGLGALRYRGQDCEIDRLLDVGFVTNDAPLDLGLLGLNPLVLGPLVDRYVRGDDLVSTFDPTDEHPFRVQTYWHVVRDTPALATLELQISLQTPWLDTRPQFECRTTWRAGELADFTSPSDPTWRVFRPANSTLSQVVMIHPTDYHDGRAQTLGQSCVVRQPLFAMSLEKGVILRSRLRWALIPRAGDLAAACVLAAAFATAPLPLTT